MYSEELFVGIAQIIEKSKQKAAVFVLSEATLMYWQLGDYINTHLRTNQRTEYGAKILATLSQQLTNAFGKGFTYTALTRMCKIADTFNHETIATLSQQLSWSHLIELAAINDELKRQFYTQMNITERWGVRTLRDKIDKMLFERTAIAKKPEDIIKKELQELQQSNYLSPDLVFKNSYVLEFLNLPALHSESDLENALILQIEQFIMELGNGFTFVERQKRISVDAIDYHLDLLFYHRKLQRLIAIDLKIGKFKPTHKAQMELYLRWLEKHEMQANENKPLGLLLCSEGNTEHVELLMLDNEEIKVAQYLTELPNKQWFADKLHRALQIAKQNTKNNEE
jgi:predicted nuclease of restriction endonuclease-like (RecB) superfamily